MNHPAVTIHFDGNGRAYQPDEILQGEYRLHSIWADEIKAVEVSVLWQSSGKGDEDMAVHDFQRIVADGGRRLGPGRPGRFSTKLPRSPMSYHGAIVKLRWCVRVRVFLSGGREVVGEKPFRLGQVLAARVAMS